MAWSFWAWDAMSAPIWEYVCRRTDAMRALLQAYVSEGET